jgi:hypothetical protein
MDWDVLVTFLGYDFYGLCFLSFFSLLLGSFSALGWVDVLRLRTYGVLRDEMVKRKRLTFQDFVYVDSLSFFSHSIWMLE